MLSSAKKNLMILILTNYQNGLMHPKLVGIFAVFMNIMKGAIVSEQSIFAVQYTRGDLKIHYIMTEGPSKHINQILRCYLMMDGFALDQTGGEEINFRGTKMLIKVSKDDSEGRHSLIKLSHPPNKGPALHIHPNAPEAYYVLEGEYLI